MPATTGPKLSVSQILRYAAKEDFKEIIVMGKTQDGELIVSSSDNNMVRVRKLLAAGVEKVGL